MFHKSKAGAHKSVKTTYDSFYRVARYSYKADNKPRQLLSVSDLSAKELITLVANAAAFKRAVKSGTLPERVSKQLRGNTVAMIFNKRSTRTRISTEGAVALMGGHPMFLGKDDIQLGVNESLRDTSTVLSSMTSGIFARVGPHADVENLAKNSSAPVINALSDMAHPLQTIADLLTIYEGFSTKKSSEGQVTAYGAAESDWKKLSDTNFKIAWVGDVNNVLFDLAIAATKLNLKLSIASPKGYELPANIRATVYDAVPPGERGHALNEVTDPAIALRDASVVVTDTWVSMGQEEEKSKRLKAFAGFQINKNLIEKGKTNRNWRFMHCLPRHKEEVDDDIFYGPNSMVFQEAENRLWAAMAVIDSFIVKKGVIDYIEKQYS